MKSIYRKLMFRVFYAFLFFFRKLFSLKKYFSKSRSYIKFLGSKYGGFYVNVEHPDSIKNLLSFGIGNDITFDLELFELTKCKVFMFDPTEGVYKFIQSQKLNINFFFYPFGISNVNSKTKFYRPLNADHISHSLVKHKNTSNEFYYADFKKWDSICEELAIDEVDILKMDIEGAEFIVVPHILESNILPKQICIELHPRFIENGINEFFKLILLFRRNNYSLAAINSSANEFLFILNK